MPRVEAAKPKDGKASGASEARGSRLFRESALYRREQWLAGQAQSEESETSSTSTDFKGENICFADSKLLEEMEDGMRELTLISSKWYTESFVYYDNHKVSIP